MPSNAVAQNDKFLGSLYGRIFAILSGFAMVYVKFWPVCLDGRNGLSEAPNLSGQSQRPRKSVEII